MTDTIEKRACEAAVYMIETGATVRAAARRKQTGAPHPRWDGHKTEVSASIAGMRNAGLEAFRIFVL